MAKAPTKDQDSFSCPICLDLLKEPVTIPCGHSYCMSCIQHCWKEDQHPDSVYSCPQCRQAFSPRPALNKSTIIAEMMEKMKNAGLLTAPAAPRGTGEVSCDVCVGTKLQAVKSCLVCLASYCETHLRPHYQSPAFQKYTLVSASTQLQQQICPHHSKLLEAYCRTDRRCVCMLCILDEHKGHEVVSAAKEMGEKQLIRSIEKTRSEVTQLIRAREKAVVSRAEELLVWLEQEITELRGKDNELEELLHTENHIYTLQVENIDIQIFTAFRDDFNKYNLFLFSLLDSCQLTLDPSTAHRQLCLTEGNTRGRYTSVRQAYPDDPGRFDKNAQVLCCEGLMGRSYWEVELDRKDGLTVAVSYKSISRKGWGYDVTFGCDQQSWRLDSGGGSKVGVYLDHRAGALSFYSITEPIVLLHKVTAVFNQPLYPGFGFGYYESAVKICDLK
uniref:Uncharacterized protein n=1 Tax=Astyanax mexicanus TaxID=7994 RepID=A0A3B1JGG3_ASTMX